MTYKIEVDSKNIKEYVFENHLKCVDADTSFSLIRVDVLKGRETSPIIRIHVVYQVYDVMPSVYTDVMEELKNQLGINGKIRLDHVGTHPKIGINRATYFANIDVWHELDPYYQWATYGK